MSKLYWIFGSVNKIYLAINNNQKNLLQYKTMYKMITNIDLTANLKRYAKPILLMIILLISASAHAFVVTYRYDFEKEGFGVQMPMQGVTVKGNHFFERYEPLYDGSTTKKLNYVVDVTAKNSNQTELEYLVELKKTLSNVTIREDLSNVKTTRYGYPYRSLKVKSGNLMKNYYFYFRGNDLVVFSFDCLLSNEDWLSGDINAAVENFMWLDQTIEVKEIGISFKLPYEMYYGLNENKNKLTLLLTDPEYAKKTNYWASVEFIAINGKIDSASIRKAFDDELKAQSSTFTYDFHVLGMKKVNTNLVCDKYVLYYYEDGNEELMKMSIYQFYTPKGILRFIHSEYYTHIGKLSKYIKNLLESINYIG
jgi:hypothetical protein